MADTEQAPVHTQAREPESAPEPAVEAELSAKGTAAEEVSADGAFADKAPADGALADRAPADVAPADRAPADKTPADAAPADATSAVEVSAPAAHDEDALQNDVEELVDVAAQRDEYLALAQRTRADFENYRKRVARESAAAQERGLVKLARELLPALDNLDRALEAAEEQDPLLEGVRLVRCELAGALGRVGIESFSPAGEPFNPALHEAILQQPVAGAEPGSVAEVYQPGYRLGESVIRPARVLVAA